MERRRFFVGIVWAVLIVPLAGCAGTEQDEPGDSTPTETLTPDSTPTETLTPPAYEVAKTEDLSYGVTVRTGVWVISDKDPVNMTDSELLRIGETVVSDVTANQDVNAIHVFVLRDEEDIGKTYPRTPARITWAPEGVWREADTVDTGDYSTHEYAIKPAIEYDE